MSRPKWLVPIATAAIGFLVTAALWSVARNGEYEAVSRALDTRARLLAESTTASFHEIGGALDRFAARLSVIYESRRELWDFDSENLFESFAPLDVIVWVDAIDQVQWTSSREGFSLEPAQSVITTRSGKALLETARTDRRAVASSPFETPSGKAILVIFPMWRDAAFDGFVADKSISKNCLGRRSNVRS